MANYKLLADNDPGGDLQEAFDEMAAETVTSTPEVMVSYRAVGARISLLASAALETAMKSTSDIPDWVDIALTSDGINVNDPQVAGLLGLLVSEHSEDIIALGVVTDQKYKGLKIGYLANARQMREEGRV